MSDVRNRRIADIQVWGGVARAGVDVRIDFVGGGFVVGQLLTQDGINAVLGHGAHKDADAAPLLRHVKDAWYSPVQGYRE